MAQNPARQEAATDGRRAKELVIVSGKGGTGKTTVTASLAAMAKDRVVADCDVDAADLHLLLEPRLQEATPFVGGRKAQINPEQCINCGQCFTNCHFSAIEPPGANGECPIISEHACEGCGLCEHLCPVNAITLSPQVTGYWSISDTDGGSMVDGCLGVGQENSGKLVSEVRSEARKEGSRKDASLLTADGPPGTSCPVIATVTGADLAVVVTEPTVSGVHDLKRLLDLCRHFKVPVRVIVNKADLCDEQLRAIYDLSGDNVRVIGEIPFDSNVHDALCAGQTLAAWNKGPAARAMRNIWEELNKELL
jgi:MinD superfamily P-loop ATPase